MSKALLEFIAATMLPLLNDPAHPHSLPKLLAKATTKDGKNLLPVHATDWNPGTFDAGVTSANIAVQWYQAVVRVAKKADPPIDTGKYKGAPLPASPHATLTIPSATITGLENATAGEPAGVTQTVTGYSMTVPLTFGTVKDPALPPHVVIAGRYRLDQDVCAVDKKTGKQADTESKLPDLKWPVDRVTGTGTFSLTAKELTADIALHVAVADTGADRVLTVTIDKITVPAGTAKDPVYELDPATLTIDQNANEDFKNIWHDMALEAFADKETGGTRLTKALLSALNTSDTRDSVSRALTEQLANALDNVMGTPTALAHDTTTANPPVDQYLFDRLRTALADDKSPLFLPDLIAGADDPLLEPYTLGKVDIGDIALGGNFDPLKNVTLDGTVTGFSNAVVPVQQAHLNNGHVTATVKLATLTGTAHVPGPPWKAKGALTCDWGIHHGLAGTFDAQAAPATLDIGLSFGGKDLDHLTITVDSAQLRVDDHNLRVTVDLTGSPSITEFANKALEQPSLKERILKGLNKTLDTKRADIGRALAKAARTGIAKHLD